MLMCKDCFTLFNSRCLIPGEKCVISGCSGSLVDIDENLASYISELNKAFVSQNLKLRTVYSCAGHYPSLDEDIEPITFPYIAFDIPACDFKNIIELFLKPIACLNEKLNLLFPDKIESNYKFDDYSHSFYVEFAVNGFMYNFQKEENKNSITYMNILNNVQFEFKNFLMYLIKTTLQLKNMK